MMSCLPLHPTKFLLFRSKSSLRMRGSPIQARVHLKDCMASMSKVKAEKGIKREVQSTTRPKKRHRARKSAGITKKYTPIQQNSGKLDNKSNFGTHSTAVIPLKWYINGMRSITVYICKALCMGILHNFQSKLKK